MVRKTKQLPQNKITATATTRKRPWEDENLPISVRELIRRPSSKTYSINNGGLTKSWEISPICCNKIEMFSSSPQLRYSTSDLKAGKGTFVHFGYCRPVIYYPLWETTTPLKHMLFSSDADNFVAVGVTGVSRPLFMFYRKTCLWYTRFRVRRGCYDYKHDPSAHKWVKYDCALVDPNSSTGQYMQLVSLVSLNRKFYALSLQGTLVVIEEVDSRMVITGVSSSRAIPSVLSRHFREYLVESDGEIWLIFLVSTKTVNVVDNVEIFRLQVENIAWKKMERLRKNKVVFAGEKRCLVADASELGCMGNCVYFINHGVDGWWIYDMARGGISPCSSSKSNL